MLLGGVEIKLIFWALRQKEKGNIHITYGCIQIVTISAVGEFKNENNRSRRMRGNETEHCRRHIVKLFATV
jgi:hypothetical protein